MILLRIGCIVLLGASAVLAQDAGSSASDASFARALVHHRTGNVAAAVSELELAVAGQYRHDAALPAELLAKDTRVARDEAGALVSQRQALQSAVEVPRMNRMLTAMPTRILGAQTLSDFLTNLDFARNGAPPSRIDPVQVREIVELSRGIDFEPNDRVSLSVISGADRGRQLVVELSVRSPAGPKLQFRLSDDGRYQIE